MGREASAPTDGAQVRAQGHTQQSGPIGVSLRWPSVNQASPPQGKRHSHLGFSLPGVFIWKRKNLTLYFLEVWNLRGHQHPRRSPCAPGPSHLHSSPPDLALGPDLACRGLSSTLVDHLGSAPALPEEKETSTHLFLTYV